MVGSTHIEIADRLVCIEPDGIGLSAAFPEFVCTYNAQAHEIIDAITAMIINAQAGLNFLRAQSPNLEQVQQVLNSIAHEGKRAAGIVVRTRALMEKVDP
jgi:hypothetical protein